MVDLVSSGGSLDLAEFRSDGVCSIFSRSPCAGTPEQPSDIGGVSYDDDDGFPPLLLFVLADDGHKWCARAYS